MGREITHVDNGEGKLVQIVSPQRLRQILDADGDDYERPDWLGDDDEWNVGE